MSIGGFKSPLLRDAVSVETASRYRMTPPRRLDRGINSPARDGAFYENCRGAAIFCYMLRCTQARFSAKSCGKSHKKCVQCTVFCKNPCAWQERGIIYMLNKEQISGDLTAPPAHAAGDEILEMDEEHVVGTLHLTGDEFFFQGHFPATRSCPRCSAWRRWPSAAALRCCPCPSSAARPRCIPASTRPSSARWQSRAIRSAWK